ncbi:hypothetical protein [Agriterribacter sp.]|uniref:hypothetical protein n=1 Tax=Agriterribacter sp. TaxID=2821509 RepID=UPI002C4A6019|nr:hypothetical protein [Agriterribacter sp.]HTN07403.1 hypothetical protein [Agriterribacter sp.]
MAPSKKYEYTGPEPNMLEDPAESYNVKSSQSKGFVFESEDDRLITDATRPAIEKLQLFTQMIRRNTMFNKLRRK